MRPGEPLVFPIILVAVHLFVRMITGFTVISFSTFDASYKVDGISRLTTVLHLTLMIAPDADFAICEGLSFCRVDVSDGRCGIIVSIPDHCLPFYFALPHSRVSPSSPSSCVSGLNLARTRRSRGVLGLQQAMIGFSVKISLKVLENSILDQFLLIISLKFGKSGSTQKRITEKSRECHNHKPQPFQDIKRKRKQTKPNKRQLNKRTKSTKISSLFPKGGNRKIEGNAMIRNRYNYPTPPILKGTLKGLKPQEQNNTRQDLKQIAS